ncbi:MAG TPA: NAD(P)-dependent oxidoreductase [Prolixibacteraceae bacterium]
MTELENWNVYNPSGKHRVLVTKELPGNEWLSILMAADYRIEVCTSKEILSKEKLIERIGNNCKAVIGQLTEKWDAELFEVLRKAGGLTYCNYAVGYDNVDVMSATQNYISIGNTPGVLTETTAEMAVALTMACSRKIVEADGFTRRGNFEGWLPSLFLGKRLWRSTVGIIGAGRIGSAYALMMIKAFQMNLIYFDNQRNIKLEKEIEAYNEYLEKTGCLPVTVNNVHSVDEVLTKADVVSLHIPLTKETHHLISQKELLTMKTDAVLINTSRGPIIAEAALAQHCKTHPDFTAGLDVFEQEPVVHEDLKQLPNITITPHIASATSWTRENMAKLAALNIKGVIEDYPAWDQGQIEPFLKPVPPKAIPSIINQSVLTAK